MQSIRKHQVPRSKLRYEHFCAVDHPVALELTAQFKNLAAMPSNKHNCGDENSDDRD